MDIKSSSRPLINEDFHDLILGMMKGSNEHQTEAETRIQDLDDLLLVKFQEETLPKIIVGVKAKILREAKRGISVSSASLKWNSMPYYSVEQGETILDLSQSGRRTDMVIEALKREFPKMKVQNTYSGPIIMWTEN